MYKMTLRRKLAIATWTRSREGNIYGKLMLDATEVNRYIDYLRNTTGEKVSITAFVGRAVGAALEATPTLNGRIAWGKYIPHETVDVSYLIAIGEGENLAKSKIDNINKKSVTEVAKELRERAEKLRAGKDESFNKAMQPLKALPTWIIRPLLRFTGWLTASLGVNMPAFGLEAFPFGGAVITSVGMFGLDEGFAPPTPFARCPLFVLVCAMADTPVVIDGEIVIRKMIPITATIDHRFMDGYQGGTIAKVIRAAFAKPWALDGLDECPYDREA